LALAAFFNISGIPICMCDNKISVFDKMSTHFYPNIS
jgi:hypothetical protein